MAAHKKIPKHILKELERLPWERISKVEDILHPESRNCLREHKVLKFIRDNVKLDRIREVEKVKGRTRFEQLL